MSSVQAFGSLDKAIRDYRESVSRLAIVESHYLEVAPALDEKPRNSPAGRRLRMIEAQVSAGYGDRIAAENLVIAELRRRSLSGHVDADTLYMAADIEPEGDTRLVVTQLSRVSGL